WWPQTGCAACRCSCARLPGCPSRIRATRAGGPGVQLPVLPNEPLPNEPVHQSPMPFLRSEHRSVSRRDVLKFALTPALLGLGTLVDTLDGHKASAANARLIDFSERLVSADQIKSAGYGGAVVYVSESRPGANFDFKPVTREYADALHAASLQ